MTSIFHLYFHHFPNDRQLHICCNWEGRKANAHFKFPRLEKVDGVPGREQSEKTGRKLFDALFPAPLRDLLGEAREKHRRGLLLRLSIPAHVTSREQLEKIPWEYALDPETDEFVGLSRRLILIRDLGNPDPLPSLAGAPPVRILVAWANPAGYGCIDASKELADIRAAWGDRAHVFELPNASFSKFCNRVRELSEMDRLHIIHFIGHGTVWDKKLPVLAFELDGKLEPVDASDFATQLEGRNDLRLIVLSSCKSAVPPENWEHDPSRSVAYALLRRGLPAVVATRSNVNGRAAEAFARVFHSSLARGLGIEIATAEARRGLAEERRNSAKEGLLEWAVPLLYCQASTGHLFDFENPERSDPLRLAITTVPDFFYSARESHRLPLNDSFVGRELLEGHTWPQVRDQIYSFIREHIWIRQEVELRLDAFLSVSFTSGYCVGTRGCQITLLHTNRRTGELEPWRLLPRRQVRDEPEWNFSQIEGSSDSHLVVAVSVSQPNVLKDAKTAWPQLTREPAVFLEASIPAGHDAILDADHAWNLAEKLAAKLKDERRGRQVHLFMAAPAAFAFYFGQLCGFLGEIQLYEHDSKKTPAYAPSILVTGRLRAVPG
jgi:hypothetical protein